MTTTFKHVATFAFLAAIACPTLAQDRTVAIPEMKVLLENDCVRVQYHDVAVGEKTPMHAHPDYVVYVLNTYKAKITLADGSQRISEHKAGESFWNDAAQHAVENMGDTPIHNLVVELKPGTSCHRNAAPQFQAEPD